MNDLTDFNYVTESGQTDDVICEWIQMCVGGNCYEYDECGKLDIDLTNSECKDTKTAGLIYFIFCCIAFVIGCIAFICQCFQKLEFIGKFSSILYIFCSICCIIGPIVFLLYGKKGAKCYDKNSTKKLKYLLSIIINKFSIRFFAIFLILYDDSINFIIIFVVLFVLLLDLNA